MTDDTAKHVIIDGMNIAYRSYYAYERAELENSGGIPTGMIFGFANFMLKFKELFPTANMVVAWDSPDGSAQRKTVLPTYKMNRSNKPRPNFYGDPLDLTRMLVRAIGVDQIEMPGWEADDVIAAFISHESRAGDSKVIISSDHDLFQLLSEETGQMKPDEKWYEVEDVIEEYGVPPHYFSVYKALVGDSSDNILGLPRFRKKKISQMVMEHDGDLGEILENCKTPLTKKEEEKIADNGELIRKNFSIVHLNRDPQQELDVLPGRKSKKVINDICQMLEFNSHLILKLRRLAQ